MALISDPQYVIQKLRLASLHIDGPLAERIITLNGPGGYVDEASSFTDPHFEYVMPTHDQSGELSPLAPKRKNSKTKRASRVPAKAKEEKKEPEFVPPHPPVPPDELFLRSPVAAVDAESNAPASALSSLIKHKLGVNNYFASYSSFCGKGENRPITLRIWLPFSDSHRDTPITVLVKTDATVEDVIGYVLYEYIDMGGSPRPLESLEAYSLRIVEDDGNIDDDFPALERGRKIEKFSFDQFALCEANRAQFLEEMEAKRAEKEKESKPKKSVIFLRVHLYSTLEIKQTSTIEAPSDILLADLLKQLCVKHKLPPEEYTLRMPDTKTDLPLNKTVSEANTATVCLMKKDRHSAGDIFVRPAGERQPQLDESVNLSFADFGNAKRYNVTRRPMFGAKQDRIFAIDGDIIHNMPAESRGRFDERTTSYHIGNIVSCELRAPQTVRIVVRRDKEKVYEFETQNHEEAEEIVLRINTVLDKHFRR